MDNFAIGVAIAGASLFVSVCVAGAGYLRKPSLVPASRIVTLESEVTRLNARLAEAERDATRRAAEITFLKSRIAVLMSEVEFWRDEYRKAKGQGL